MDKTIHSSTPNYQTFTKPNKGQCTPRIPIPTAHHAATTVELFVIIELLVHGFSEIASNVQASPKYNYVWLAMTRLTLSIH
jgi:hypothetical protein